VPLVRPAAHPGRLAVAERRPPVPLRCLWNHVLHPRAAAAGHGALAARASSGARQRPSPIVHGVWSQAL